MPPDRSVQFFADGIPSGEPVRLDDAGRARGQFRLGAGVHQLAAAFTPNEGTSCLPGRSADEPHTVRRTVTTGEPAVITTQSNN